MPRDHELGLRAQHEFRIQRRKRPEPGRHDIADPDPGQRLADERGRAGGVRAAVDLEVGAPAAPGRRHARRCGVEPLLHALPGLATALGIAQQRRQRQQAALDVGVAVGVEGQHAQPERLGTLGDGAMHFAVDASDIMVFPADDQNTRVIEASLASA